MKLNKRDLKMFFASQCRAWGGLMIWKYFSVVEFYSVAGLLEFVAFLMLTEMIWGMLRLKGKT